jgi:plasmid maintenance system antidote protein VapI
MRKSLLEHNDDRAALRQRAEEWKAAAPGATYQSLAKACRVQKAYLSRVLQEKAELTADQLFLACEHLGIAGSEREYLTVLHAYCRSDVAARRRQLAAQLAALRERDKETIGHVAATPVEGSELERLAPLFLDPEVQLVHLHLMIERYRLEPKAVAAALGLTAERLEKILELLRRLGLIAVGADGVLATRAAMHLPVDSPLFRPYRTLLRQRALARQEQLPEKTGYSLSLLFSATRGVEATLRRRILELLAELEPEVRAAPSEEVFFFGVDLFPWAVG